MTDDEQASYIAEKLESIENRLARVELKVDRAIGSRKRPLLTRLRPKHALWRFQQHRPRPLYIPDSYRTQPAPDPCPRIALVTPAFNHARFLGATIESVVSQECPSLVYTVQDGASTDGTKELLESYSESAFWRSEPDDGQAQAINRGFSGIQCDIMGYLNSDDVLLPGTLAYIANYFATHPDIDVVYGHRINIDREGLEIGRAILPRHDEKAIKWADYIPQETMFWRRRVWDALNGIDESFRFAMDWDFILRAQQEGFKLARVPRFLACFRIHDSQKTAALAHVGEEEMKLLRLLHLGRIPNHYEIRQNIKPYLIRQILHQWAYRWRLLRYR